MVKVAYMKILICPNEIVFDQNTNETIGVRLCDIAEAPFEVASPLFWVDCPNDVTGTTHCYNLESKTFIEIPALIPASAVIDGVQTL